MKLLEISDNRIRQYIDITVVTFGGLKIFLVIGL
jgi:hypothetical protein